MVFCVVFLAMDIFQWIILTMEFSSPLRGVSSKRWKQRTATEAAFKDLIKRR
jgi:hypothetical protein